MASPRESFLCLVVLLFCGTGLRCTTVRLHHHLIPEEPIVTSAVCVLSESVNDNVTGTFILQQKDPDGVVKIKGDVEGLSPGLHGFHIHRVGDLSAGCTGTGDHFDVGVGSEHGGRQDVWRHVGDLGNVEADTTGDSHFLIHDYVISLNGPNSVIGRSFITTSRRRTYRRGETEDCRSGLAAETTLPATSAILAESFHDCIQGGSHTRLAIPRVSVAQPARTAPPRATPQTALLRGPGTSGRRRHFNPSPSSTPYDVISPPGRTAISTSFPLPLPPRCATVRRSTGRSAQ
ncbi:superoxide dismutase [Cu-Zn]-like isoform X1 [Ornithodoros turicata]|uniref:superoxide dismutase [Cu-Zn]-like isoform X1 n=1 Tax=Ornithodoros turicata TaxID=34597 RepID=UPI003139EC37